MISILLPSRGRPENITRLYDSVKKTADDFQDIEFVIAIDVDDPADYEEVTKPMQRVRLLPTERTTLSVYWNNCHQVAHGPIYMHCGDDIIFRTKGWDTQVKQVFDESADKILFVHGDDGFWGENFGTHGFIHKKWAETVGYFVPPYFSSDYNDTWLNDVANLLGRRRYLPFLTEHMHFAFNKGPLDQTHKDRLERHQADNVDELYQTKAPERDADAEKLRKVMQ